MRKGNWVCSWLILLALSFGAVTNLMALSPLIQVSPEYLEFSSLRFEVEVKATKDGGRDYIVRITQKQRDFRSRLKVGVASIRITERSEGGQIARLVPYTPKGREITVYFHVTAEELEDPETAFWYTEPVFVESDGGRKLSPAPAINSFYFWFKDFPPE